MSTLTLPWFPIHRPRAATASPLAPSGWITLLAWCARRTAATVPALAYEESLPVAVQRSVRVSTPTALLDGVLARPTRARALVLLLDASARGSDAPGNRMVASALAAAGYATLSVSLLVGDEALGTGCTTMHGAELSVCTRRTVGVLQWVASHPGVAQLPLCVFAAGTSAACALAACAERAAPIQAVVCRGGRPELVGSQLDQVRTPTLFLVGENDGALLAMSHSAALTIAFDSRVAAVPGTRNLLGDEHAIEPVVRATLAWFDEVLARAEPGPSGLLPGPPAPAALPQAGH